jgi:hypothetical protein
MMGASATLNSSAILSPCGRYRYHLRRDLAWQPGLFQLAHDHCQAPLMALHTTKAGFPSHPLYLSKDSELRPWVQR